VAQAEEARSHARDVESGVVGRLRVGFVGSMLFRGLPPWLERFRTQQPRVDISLKELNSQEQIDSLLHDGLDLGFIHTDRVHERLETSFVHAEPFLACVHESHPLHGARRMPLARLRADPFVLFSRGASPHYYRRIIEMCNAQGFDPLVKYEVRHWLSVVSLVAQGMGVSVVPRSLEKSGMAGAVFVPLAEKTPPSEVHAVWLRDRPDPARAMFMEVVGKKRRRPVAASEV
jgi:DNA-binding transcriptional LysR family regulator